MNYKTPLAKAHGLGSANTGTVHWWMQRVSAVVLIPLSFWLVIFINHLSNSTFQETVAWLSLPLNSVLLISWILAVFYHAALGVQVVIEDYVHTEPIKLISIWLVKLIFLFLTLVSILATFRIVIPG